jgi:hypothetical protein
MNLQPGNGYTLRETSEGVTLDIDFPIPPEQDNREQFKVNVSGNNVHVVEGRVIAQMLTDMPTTRTTEYSVQAFAVYPTDKHTIGTEAASIWCSQNGHVEIQKFTPGATEEDLPTGSNAWGVYLVRKMPNVGSEDGQTERPFLAVMADGSDAETKSKPWNSTGQHGDLREYYTIRERQSVEVSQPDGSVFYGGLIVGQHGAVKRYNCQRLKIASINWYDTTGWVVTQWLIGTLYMPNNVHFYGELDFEAGDDAPDTDWPLNTAENEDWSGAWTGYEKNFNTGGLTRTTEVLP